MKNAFIAILLLSLLGCNTTRDFPEVKKLSEYPTTDFVTTPQSPLQKDRNVVYSVSLLLAWQKVKALHTKEVGVWGNPIGFSYLNRSDAYKNTLAEDEYKSAVDFNEEEQTITATASFNMALPFLSEFDSYPDRLTFNGEKVAAFGLKGSNDSAARNVTILYYEDDDNFVIKLRPKDATHEIILCKGLKNNTTMQQLFNEAATLIATGNEERKQEQKLWRYTLKYSDALRIPKMAFNIEHEYPKLKGGKFIIKDKDYAVDKVWQRTAFILDEAGAKVESEAEVYMEASEEINLEAKEKPHPKKLHLNKPFVLLLKKTNTKNPYLGLYITNTELFE